MANIGTIHRDSDHVYPYGVGSGDVGTSTAGRTTVRSVSHAGIDSTTMIANIVAAPPVDGGGRLSRIGWVTWPLYLRALRTSPPTSHPAVARPGRSGPAFAAGAGFAESRLAIDSNALGEPHAYFDR